ncbi:MAG: Protein translocase subunit SecA [Candidatus Magasanikbacteria bacterium GW2011_GWC2_40_17]|uniref:Protein translocase subunit SecA n=1 Tax=Candidatus Magasanikbacteria bacterium GW2011_GWA2_42_32 TaxID=1619039 RepID=A0A0G1A8V4_9BACT|nr:MAG: Protein translocase subunit SecA [Candidatus Magasanikbacteria bacterium GW2011_GWC2_40_17]KKS57455.1 MAG: Protein translocase subunit SecA [Candidatus Magasanikbacteria bacterium GW2011_GWA2_42_32]
MSILTKIFGNPNAREVKNVLPIIEEINSLEKALENLSLEQLKDKTREFKERLSKGEALDSILPEAFAVVREAAKKIIGQRHYDVQLIGGIFLHRGNIAEMRTGEGKTLTATAAVYLNALTGRGVHVVTVNDYLAKRDAVWMGQIYHALGLTVSCIQQQTISYIYEPGFQENSVSQAINLDTAKTEAQPESEQVLVKVEPSHLRPCSRKEAYACDILYGTNNEFGFDYLRDNMATNLREMVQRDLHYAIVDEVDSILVDEARTPLIISAPAEEATEKYYKFADLVRRLKENEDYNIDEKMRSATLTEAGINKMEEWLGVGNIYAEGGVQTVHHIEQALKAQTLFKKDKDYVVKDGEIIIVDEFTGRLMFGRRYSEGLHQAIEAKEGVDIQRESQTLATITFQNYFRMYEKLSGMTGTAATEAEEFAKIYNLEVVEIPTNKEMVRRDLSDRIYKNETGKFTAVVREVKERYQKGQPVLIGTISIEKNEALSEALAKEGVPHQILNAKNHEREAEIISQAGRLSAVTLATNMAGRGVDIILGGNPSNPEEAKKVRELGGLHVLGTERHESRRIDNQLRGRSGRQGDPGSSQFYVSLEDDLMRIFGSERIKKMMDFLKIPEDMPIENKMISKSLESAQHKVEGHNFDIRKHLLDYDDVINKHRTVIYKKRREILDEYEKEKEIILKGEPVEETPETLRGKILDMVEKEIEQFVYYHTAATVGGDWNVKEIIETASTIFILTDAEKAELLKMGGTTEGRLEEAEERTKIIEFLVELSKKRFAEMEKEINNPELALEIKKGILLRAIDTLWVDHLVAIDYLRAGIGLRGYGQRDPLVEYKREAYRLFNELVSLIQKEVVYSIYKVTIGVKLAPSLMQRQGVQLSGAQKEAGTTGGALVRKKEFAEDGSGHKIGRNDSCPCGSGKKYKRCHGA